MKIIKRIREIVATPFLIVAITLEIISKIIYGKGFEYFVLKIIKDLHNYFHHR